MAYISPVLTAIANAAKKASVSLLRDFNELEHLQNSLRNDGSYAMRSLLKAQKTLRDELAKFKPSYGFVFSSKDVIPSSGNYFLVSAIDGYANFAHGNAAFATSIAMVENNAVVDAVVYAPAYDELYYAEKGSGAFKEGFRNLERIRIAVQKKPENALASINADSAILPKILPLVQNTLITGVISLDLAHIACGKTDIAISSKCTPAEVAGGMLLVKEAGGYAYEIGTTDVRSENLEKVLFGGTIFATNEALREKIALSLAEK